MQFSFLPQSTKSNSTGMGVAYDSKAAEEAIFLDSQFRNTFPVGPNYLMDQVLG